MFQSNSASVTISTTVRSSNTVSFCESSPCTLRSCQFQLCIVPIFRMTGSWKKAPDLHRQATLVLFRRIMSRKFTYGWRGGLLEIRMERRPLPGDAAVPNEANLFVAQPDIGFLKLARIKQPSRHYLLDTGEDEDCDMQWTGAVEATCIHG